jgi:hypothetical protein
VTPGAIDEAVRKFAASLGAAAPATRSDLVAIA